MGQVKSSPASREKELQSENRKYVIFGRRLKKTTPWRNAGSVYVFGVPDTNALPPCSY